ncbi:MAG: phosphatase PAP2 family protein [Hyphomicrobiales bacterium]|nr:phosphatase PAP2 family protein [Hyphomicrobiales bacterium]
MKSLGSGIRSGNDIGKDQIRLEAEGERSRRERNLWAAALALVALAGIMVATAIDPHLDISLAAIFYEGADRGFGMRSQANLRILRELGYYLPFLVLLIAGLVLLHRMRNSRAEAALSARRFLFLALSFALGPGLLVNGVLKEMSHRPRPSQIVEYGGISEFRPWYAVDGTCDHNCSFASGEVAGATWLVAPASLLPPPWRAVALASAGLLTLAVALLRMAFGGHFASDAAAAAWVTLGMIFAFGWLLLRRRAGPYGFDASRPRA